MSDLKFPTLPTDQEVGRSRHRKPWSLLALRAAFRSDSSWRDRMSRPGATQVDRGLTRDGHLDLFFAILAATDSWPTGSFGQWLENKRQGEAQQDRRVAP